MPSALDLLTEWLSEGTIAADRGSEINRWPIVGWRCLLFDGEDKFKGFGPTPDAAIRAAVEKARAHV